MKTFRELYLKRQSTRAFSPEAVEKELMEKCLEAARYAPSACNAQPWTFIVVDDPEKKKGVSDASWGPLMKFNKFTANAGAMVVICAEKPNFNSQVGGWLKNLDYELFDIGISANQFCLQAAELGLGTCMLGWFDEKKIKKILDLPKKTRIALLIAVGYPANNNIRLKKRKEIDTIRDYNKYPNPQAEK